MPHVFYDYFEAILFFRICFLLRCKLIAYFYDSLLLFDSFLHISKCNHYTYFKCLYFSFSLFAMITISHSTINKLLHTLKSKSIEPSHSQSIHSTSCLPWTWWFKFALRDYSTSLFFIPNSFKVSHMKKKTFQLSIIKPH